jgi:hypothetical protein
MSFEPMSPPPYTEQIYTIDCSGQKLAATKVSRSSNTPHEAIATFFSTEIDRLFLENVLVRRVS